MLFEFIVKLSIKNILNNTTQTLQLHYAFFQQKVKAYSRLSIHLKAIGLLKCQLLYMQKIN